MDASKLSLEMIGHQLRLHVKVLSFNHISDFMENDSPPEMIDGFPCNLRLWKSNTMVPASLDQNLKAFAIPLEQEVLMRTRFAPTHVRDKFLICYTPHDDIFWASQVIDYRMNGSVLNGESIIRMIDDHSLHTFVLPTPEFWLSVARAIEELFERSIRIRESNIHRLREGLPGWRDLSAQADRLVRPPVNPPPESVS